MPNLREINKRLQRLVNANQLMARELSDLQSELGQTAPVSPARNQKKMRQAMYEQMIIGKKQLS